MSKQKQHFVVNNKKKEFKFKVRDKQICFSGNFDSGNLQKVEQITPYIYRITSGNDKIRYSSRKSLFHYKVSGLSQYTITFLISKIELLEQLITMETIQKIYHPVVRKQSQKTFQKIKDNIKLYYNMQNQPEMSFSYTFTKQQQTQFAFTYPYTYEDGQNFIKSMINIYENHQEIKFKKKVLCRINDKFNVDILKITSKEIIRDNQSYSNDKLKVSKSIKKPKVLITARVHPGQSPSSFCVQGIIRYLLNQNDYRSYLLRKHFEFIIVPMLNPEGVYNGFFRSDLNGYNLNRVYYCADEQLHKSIWSLKKYLETIETIDFYFDLHGHSGFKDFFIYGNAFRQLEYQVEAQIFGKIIEYNCPYFQNLNCIFTQEAMKSKDKYDKLTKQGCGRVFFHKKFNIIHSYTVQCGFFAPKKNKNYPSKSTYSEIIIQNKYRQTNEWQQYSIDQYLPQNYMFLGKAILNSILDLFNLNPFTKIPNNNFYFIDKIRIQTAQKIFSQYERFHLSDENTIKKMKVSSNLIEKKYYQKRFGYCGLSINKKKLQIAEKNKDENSLLKSERKLNELQNQEYEQHLIRSQTFLQQQNDKKLKSTLPPMKNTLSSNKIKKFASIETKFQEEDEQQTIIGGVHEQIFKQFSRYNKSTQKQQKYKRKRIQTEIINKKLTMRDLGANKKSKFFNIQTLNLNNIKKQVLQHLINKKKISPSKSSNKLIKKNNFRIINGIQSSKRISAIKFDPQSSKPSLVKFKVKS